MDPRFRVNGAADFLAVWVLLFAGRRQGGLVAEDAVLS
ncbi:hypothetical protein JMA_00870 [Jeotgalibacillus malaysiensis]|uniref:Uncharacterized protein n=1 Tax=Jeotgalibacillus malaysiensis TaxID=1508404 RepID=A0A0B5AN48_9BACL|nr:hypothetical protein JMA_00870 [Jeotgalibacillus malaysiensis]